MIYELNRIIDQLRLVNCFGTIIFAIMIVLIWLAKIVGAILLLFAAYFLLGFIGSWIPVNIRYRRIPKHVDIYISSNGVHTDFIVPAITDTQDWRELIDDRIYATPFSEETWLGVGWGDRGFYLDIEEWANLTPKIAMKAMLVPSPTLMHIESYKAIPTNKKRIEKISITEEQYAILCQFIKDQFAYQQEEVIHIPNVGYTPDDHFYHARGKYHAFNTCNYWVNRGLKRIGVRTSLFTHWDKGMFIQIKRAKAA